MKGWVGWGLLKMNIDTRNWGRTPFLIIIKRTAFYKYNLKTPKVPWIMNIITTWKKSYPLLWKHTQENHPGAEISAFNKKHDWLVRYFQSIAMEKQDGFHCTYNWLTKIRNHFSHIKLLKKSTFSQQMPSFIEKSYISIKKICFVPSNRFWKVFLPLKSERKRSARTFKLWTPHPKPEV